jgi:rhodanese-related sulfurtransferase
MRNRAVRQTLIRRSEKTSNLLIVALVIYAGFELSRSYLSPLDATHPDRDRIEKQVKIGTNVANLRLDWAKTRETLLLAVAPDCRYCSESAPFYQAISKEIENRSDIRLVAVMPKTSINSKKYLNEIGIITDEIKEIQLSSIGVTVTPTLILVNEKGVVENVISGKLKPDGEVSLLERLKINKDDYDRSLNPASDDSSSSLERITATELISETKRGRQLITIDLRDRDDYAQGHIPGAKNIPVDELAARARKELSYSDDIVLYCDCYQDDISKIAAQTLREHGFMRLKILREGIHGWRQMGLAMNTSSSKSAFVSKATK